MARLCAVAADLMRAAAALRAIALPLEAVAAISELMAWAFSRERLRAGRSFLGSIARPQPCAFGSTRSLRSGTPRPASRRSPRWLGASLAREARSPPFRHAQQLQRQPLCPAHRALSPTGRRQLAIPSRANYQDASASSARSRDGDSDRSRPSRSGFAASRRPGCSTGADNGVARPELLCGTGAQGRPHVICSLRRKTLRTNHPDAKTYAKTYAQSRYAVNRSDMV